jgi:hypothetical protein
MANEPNVPNRTPSPADIEVIDGIAWYRGSTPFEELEFPPMPEGMAEDYDWAMNDLQVQKDYGGLVVAVRHRKVWGAGKSYRAALEQARQQSGCPPGDDLVFAIPSGPPFETRKGNR